jgi:hypothetical protein
MLCPYRQSEAVATTPPDQNVAGATETGQLQDDYKRVNDWHTVEKQFIQDREIPGHVCCKQGT